MGMTEFINEWRNDCPWIEAHTSGSTGKPKAIRLLKSDMLSSATATNAFFGIDRYSTLAIPLSADYIAGKMMAVRAEAAGCRLLEMPVSNDVRVECPIDLLAVVPSQIESLLGQPEAAGLVKNLLVGGAPLTDEPARRLVAAGFNAWLGYGMTETCSHVALRRVDSDEIFKAMEGIRFSTDSRDCLTIESERFSWGSLMTNDVVELLSPTSFRWLGRADNAINSGGLKLHSEQLEKEYRAAIGDLPPFYLAGEPDPKWGERLVMVAENPPEGLLERIKSLLPDRRKAPGRIVGVDTLPRTDNGKIRRIVPDR